MVLSKYLMKIKKSQIHGLGEQTILGNFLF